MMRVIKKTVVLFSVCAIVSLCFCHGDKNLYKRRNDDKTCDASDDCVQYSSDEKASSATKSAWKPFRYTSPERWTSLKSMYPLYVKWHNDTLYDKSIPCHKKRALVFSPNAGLGDSIGALTSAFTHAIKSGRLFFINWKPYEWTVGFRAPEFAYDYSRASSLRHPLNHQQLLCLEESDDPASFLLGHVTNDHPVVRDTTINDYIFDTESLYDTFLHPSPEVEKIVKTVLKTNLKKKADGDDGATLRLVALVVRTGIGEYNQFLSEGDEENFVKCFRNYAKSFSKQSSTRVRYRVFVTSDNEEVKQKVVKELKEGDNLGQSVDVVTLNDSIIHVMQVPEKSKRRKSIRDKIRKTYAEYFLISRCQVLFLTHGSLFGRAAAETGKVKEANIHFISDSTCDGKRDKYSYLQCHDPKFPTICGFS